MTMLASKVYSRTVANHYVRAALHGAKQRGEDIEVLLARAGIPASVLSEPLARVSFEQFARLVQLLWQQLDDELMGFSEKPIRLGAFAMMSRAVLHCATLGRALRRAQRFYSLLGDGRPHFQVERDDGVVWLAVDESQLDDPDHILAEMIMVTLHRFCSWLISQRIPMLEVCFSYAEPAHRREYDLIFSAPLRFEAGKTAFGFAASYLDAPVVQDVGSLRVFLRNSAHELLWRRDYDNHLSTQIRRMFAHDARGPSLNLGTVAERLAMSPQTLRRHLLQDEGVSFQTLKDQWRRDLAISLLTETTLSTAEIARRTGFAETSAFHHAFKKWTGLAPSAYRP